MTELIRENLSMSIVSETSSAKLIELLFRNESRNFVVDARQPELTCRNDTSNRWQEFMLNGLFEYMTFDVSYVTKNALIQTTLNCALLTFAGLLQNFREKYNYSAGKECVFWQHPHYAVYAYIDLQDARQPFCSLISFDGEDVWKYKSVTFETEVIDEKVFRVSSSQLIKKMMALFN